MEKAKKPGKRGRPVDEGKREEILDVATTLFMAKGFHATSMDDIAHNASMSKLTLYRRFPDKNALFQAVIERKCQQYLPSDMAEKLKGKRPHEIIKAFGESFFALLMSEDAQNMHRMIMAEAVNHPEMAQMFYQTGPVRVKKMADEMLHEFKKQGMLKDQDILNVRTMLLTLFIGPELYFNALLRVGDKPTQKKINAYVDQATELFIDQYLKPME